MTIKEIAKQIHQLSGGMVNGEKFTKAELEIAFRKWMQTGNRYIGSVVLPDGEWLFSLDRFGQKPDEYDYFIPYNRGQEQELYKVLGLA